MPLTYRLPFLTILPLTGNAGEIIVYLILNSSSIASITGPMLPCFVLSKVEQYLKYNCLQPLFNKI